MSNKITLGAIRWDAWYGRNESDLSILSQVERSLSPREYHFRAPFFSTVEDGKIVINEYTEKTFEQELDYAKIAGIDYFAYVWYDGVLAKVRKIHASHPRRNEVKLCAVLDDNAIGHEYARKELSELIKEDFFMTVCNGRPLMFYFGNGKNQPEIAEEINFYKEFCRKANVPEPYAVVMNNSWGDGHAHGSDAVSQYSVSAENGVPFAQTMDNVRSYWQRWLDDGGHIVPIISAGWHSKPRFDNPVKWMTVDENCWGDYATADQIATLTGNAFDFIRNHSDNCEAKTAIVYAWNEHDEGGWLCPTIAVDENGDPLFENDGTAKINCERIVALSKVAK